jgi:hypothetical protein
VTVLQTDGGYTVPLLWLINVCADDCCLLLTDDRAHHSTLTLLLVDGCASQGLSAGSLGISVVRGAGALLSARHGAERLVNAWSGGALTVEQVSEGERR